MKTCLNLRPISVAVTALLLAGPAALVLAQTSPVKPINITINTDDHTAYGTALPNTTVKSETRTEKLDILLQNTTQQSYPKLTLRYCIFDKDVQSQKIAVALKHETPIAIPAFTTLAITSQVASISYTPNHTTATTIKQKATKKGGAETTKETPVKAAGKEFAGYGIQVLQTDPSLVVGQLFSSLDLTNHFTAAFRGANKNP